MTITFRGRRTPALLPVLALGAGLLLAGCSGDAAADCPAPTLTASKEEVAPGDRIELTGTALGCDDTASEDDAAAQEAFPVMWQQGGREVRIHDAKPDDAGDFTLDVVVPAGAVPGEARLVVGTTELELEVVG